MADNKEWENTTPLFIAHISVVFLFAHKKGNNILKKVQNGNSFIERAEGKHPTLSILVVLWLLTGLDEATKSVFNIHEVLLLNGRTNSCVVSCSWNYNHKRRMKNRKPVKIKCSKKKYLRLPGSKQSYADTQDFIWIEHRSDNLEWEQRGLICWYLLGFAPFP